jgi:hypothetical protein
MRVLGGLSFADGEYFTCEEDNEGKRNISGKYILDELLMILSP